VKDRWVEDGCRCHYDTLPRQEEVVAPNLQFRPLDSLDEEIAREFGRDSFEVETVRDEAAIYSDIVVMAPEAVQNDCVEDSRVNVVQSQLDLLFRDGLVARNAEKSRQNLGQKHEVMETAASNYHQ
jgi:hypothetical protein